MHLSLSIDSNIDAFSTGVHNYSSLSNSANTYANVYLMDGKHSRKWDCEIEIYFGSDIAEISAARVKIKFPFVMCISFHVVFDAIIIRKPFGTCLASTEKPN